MRVVVLISLILAFSLDVEAIAVASDYLPGNILEMIEGTSKIYKINLQNPDSFETVYKVTYDDSYMKAIDFKEEYILPPKSSVTVQFNVTAPGYNKDNNLYGMSFTVHELTGAGPGIGFLGKINKQIKLKVIKDPNRFHIDFYIVGYAIVFLAIFFFLYKKKKPRRKRKLNRKIIK